MRLIEWSVDNSYAFIGGLEVVDDREWALYKEALECKPSLYFYEEAGKHSEFEVSVNDINVKTLSEDAEFIKKFECVVGLYFGSQPLTDRIREALEG